MSDSKTSMDVNSPNEVDSTTSMTKPSRLPVEPPALPLLCLIFEGEGGGSNAYPPDELDEDDDDVEELLPL